MQRRIQRVKTKRKKKNSKRSPPRECPDPEHWQCSYTNDLYGYCIHTVSDKELKRLENIGKIMDQYEKNFILREGDPEHIYLNTDNFFFQNGERKNNTKL